MVRIGLDWSGRRQWVAAGDCLNGVVEGDIGRRVEGGGGFGGLEVLQCYNPHKTE